MTRRQRFLLMLVVAGLVGWLTVKTIGPWWAWFPACLMLGLLIGDVSRYLADREES